jgi:glutamine synthetase
MGFTPMMATELEFFLFEKSFDDYRKGGLSRSAPISGYNEDYPSSQTTKEEDVMRPIRNHLVAAGVPVENTKGEAEAGQEELNIRYADALLRRPSHDRQAGGQGNRHGQHGHSPPRSCPSGTTTRSGSATHMCTSRCGQGRQTGLLRSRRRQLRHVGHDAPLHGRLDQIFARLHLFPAPYVNSYKRFMKGTFAPTKTPGRSTTARPVSGCAAKAPRRAHRVPHRRQRHQPLSGAARRCLPRASRASRKVGTGCARERRRL